MARLQKIDWLPEYLRRRREQCVMYGMQARIECIDRITAAIGRGHKLADLEPDDRLWLGLVIKRRRIADKWLAGIGVLLVVLLAAPAAKAQDCRTALTASVQAWVDVASAANDAWTGDTTGATFKAKKDREGWARIVKQWQDFERDLRVYYAGAQRDAKTDNTARPWKIYVWISQAKAAKLGPRTSELHNAIVEADIATSVMETACR